MTAVGLLLAAAADAAVIRTLASHERQERDMTAPGWWATVLDIPPG